MLKTFDKAVRFLESYIPEPAKKHPGKLGLERMKYLVSLLGDPQLKYLTVHVGGTSGKGSTAIIIASILAEKYKVGLHTSPHLEKVTERIKIVLSIKGMDKDKKNSPKLSIKDIPDPDFTRLVNSIEPIIKRVENSNYGKPSYFEITTALAFLYFAKEKVDIAIIEVGMGGRYDGTNVVRPLVAVITNVGLDHTEVLGETVEEIAQDKAGIIKKEIKVVSGVNQPSVVEIIKLKCRKEKAGLSLLTPQPSRMASANLEGFLQTPSPQGNSFRLRRAVAKAAMARRRQGYGGQVGLPLGWFNRFFGYKVTKISSEGSVFDYYGENTYKNLKLLLLGEHQIKNACLAIRTIEELSNYPCLAGHVCRQAGRRASNQLIKKRDIQRALERVFIPGRLEIVSKRPLVILDGAHNPDKMKALISAIKSIFPSKKVICIIAIKKGKNAKSMLSYLLPICSKVFFTKFKLTTDLGDTYSYEPEELVNTIKDTEIKDIEMRIVKDSQKAVNKAIKSVKKDDLILVTGSLYLVGEIKGKIRSTKSKN